MGVLEIEAFLASESETQGPLSLPALYSGVHSLVPSSSDQ